MKISKHGHDITSVCDWFAYAPPKKRKAHWVDGRSAKELAKVWFPTKGKMSVPEELSSLLVSSNALGSVKLCYGEPEVTVPFDSFRGEKRNCDLLVHGVCDLGKISISIEAKADEKFGKTIGEEFDAGGRKPRSNVPERIRLLCDAVLHRSVHESRDVRYQLLYGVAAALSAAQQHGATVAVFVVHEFVTTLTKGINHASNRADLDRFVHVLSGDVDAHLHAGQMLGSIRVRGNSYIPGNVDLYLGKIMRDLKLCAPRRLSS